MRIRIALATCVAATAGVLTMSGPADAASVCQSHDISFKAFVGHNVDATFRECHGGAYGKVPRQHLTSVSKPIVTYPTRVPTGLGETLHTSQKVYLYSKTPTLYKFRFSVEQGHVKFLPHSTYNFEIQVRSRYISSLGAPVGRICFVGQKCSKWQN